MTDIPKPAHGLPCNGCGWCCRFSLCIVAETVFGHGAPGWKSPTPGPCPALEQEADGRSRCGLVANPSIYAPARTLKHGVHAMREAALSLIGNGIGCDALQPGEEADHAFEDRMRLMVAQRRKQMNAALKLWGYHC